MPYVSIPDASREVGEPVTKDLVDTIHNNLEDLNTRVASISLAAGSNVLVNELKKKPKDSLPIGSIVFASLSSAQFTAEADGGEWVAVDGSSVAGSDWATLTGRSVLPDIRGRFIRAKANGSGNAPTDPALDTYTADTVVSHDHNMSHPHSNTFGLTGSTTFADNGHRHTMVHEHQWGSQDGAGALNSYTSGGAAQQVAYGSYEITAGMTGFKAFTVSGSARNHYTKGVINADAYAASVIPLTGLETTAGATVGFAGAVTSHSGNTGLTGAAETAPRYVTENVFIKINRAYIQAETRLYVVRVLQQTTINNVLVSPVSQGTSGNFQIDIRKGNTPLTASQSIFQAGNLPTLAWNASAGVTGLTDSDQNTVAAGQFIVVVVTATQAKLKEVHISISGDY